MSDLMIDFEAMSAKKLAELSVRSAPAKNVIHHTITAPVQTITQTPARGSSKTHLTASESEWDWQQLRDYVINQIEAIHGPQPRNPVKEKSIFSSFLKRWGAQAPAIARAAFEVHQGFWHSAPISVNRFCKASDLYFSTVIAERLGQ